VGHPVWTALLVWQFRYRYLCTLSKSAVKYVSHLLRRVLWITINMSIMESVLILVICSVNHLVIRACLSHIRLYILKIIPLPVCVTKHSKWRNILRIIFCCTVQSKLLILKCINLHVMCNKSFSGKSHYQNIAGNLLNICDVCSVAEGTSNVQKSSMQL
jgi:hypothetical protein